MRRSLVGLIVTLFDLLPKKLSVRSFFIFWSLAPYLIVKFKRRSLLRKKPKQTSVTVNDSDRVELERLLSIPPDFTGRGDEVCVRYSGGTDSTLAAAYMAMHFRKVHLLTFGASYQGLTLNTVSSDPSSTMVNVQLLKKKYGRERFVHHVIDVQPLRDELYFKQFQYYAVEKDFLRVSLCPACTMAMHKLAIDYCKRNAVTAVTDGSCGESGAFPWQMQHRDNMKSIGDVYEQQGLTYIVNPCYKISESGWALLKMGVINEPVDRKSFSYRRKTQQFCIPIQLQSLCRNLYGREMPKDSTSVRRFIKSMCTKLVQQ